VGVAAGDAAVATTVTESGIAIATATATATVTVTAIATVNVNVNVSVIETIATTVIVTVTEKTETFVIGATTLARGIVWTVRPQAVAIGRGIGNVNVSGGAIRGGTVAAIGASLFCCKQKR
jgi:hypothetical protein